MWGKLSTTTIGGVRVGVIPTCVGQIVHEPLASFAVTGPSPRTWGSAEIQPLITLVCEPSPRTWGNDGTNFKQKLLLESSPRAWGKRFAGKRSHEVSRAIPTHVGQIPGCDADENGGQSYPHTRGENA